MIIAKTVRTRTSATIRRVCEIEREKREKSSGEEEWVTEREEARVLSIATRVRACAASLRAFSALLRTVVVGESFISG